MKDSKTGISMICYWSRGSFRRAAGPRHLQRRLELVELVAAHGGHGGAVSDRLRGVWWVAKDTCAGHL